MAVYPVTAGRTSDALLTRRLLLQLQSEQKRMLQVEQQLSTGRRIQLPSEDSVAASRAVTLQRMLEAKTQLQSNLSTSQSFLDATDTALNSVAQLLTEVRGLAVRAADTTTGDLEREAMALEIDATIRQMLDLGNKKFRDRYLFAGTESTTRPFESFGKFVTYLGNDATFRTYAEQDMLFATNVPGQELFGAVSGEVRGVDLDPVLDTHTHLADLRGGLGITAGSVVISDGSNSSTVSLVGARTIGDVARLIESNPPAGRTVQATVGSEGLVIQIDAAGGGSLIVSDLVGGSTAAELGIVRRSGPATVPIVGGDLDPIVRLTTRLDDTRGAGGGAWDSQSGLQVVNGGETYVLDFQGAETVEDLLNIVNGSDAMLLAEINADQTGINVRSRLSGADLFIGENGGTTATDLGLRTFSRDTSLAELNNGRGVLTTIGADFTIQRKDGFLLEIDLSSARTVGDVIDLINDHPDNLDPGTAVTAGLPAAGNGLVLTDNNVSAVESLTVRRQVGSHAAWDLGLVPRGEDTSLPATASGGAAETLLGRDTNPVETVGVFNSLLRLFDAVHNYDVTELERVVEMLDDDFDRLNFGRAALGARAEGLDGIALRNEDDQVELRAVLSDEIDMDLAVAATNYSARQAAYEASLRTIAGLFRLSLLDFL